MALKISRVQTAAANYVTTGRGHDDFSGTGQHGAGQQDGSAAGQRLRLRIAIAHGRASQRRFCRIEPTARGQHERPSRRDQRQHLTVRHGQRGLRAEDALGARYVAHRYAQFVTARGLTLDIGTIARFSIPKIDACPGPFRRL